MPQQPQQIIQYGKCPSCKHDSVFKYIGHQHWPESVALRLGIPTTIALYECEKCQTSVNEFIFSESSSSASV